MTAPAAADPGGFVDLFSEDATIRRDGVDYQISLDAFQFADTESLSVTLSRTRNPDGVRFASQSHTWDFQLEGDRFNIRDDLSRATIDTGRQLGRFGRIDVVFEKTGPIERSCDGLNREREGRLSGTFRFDTGTEKFGTITMLPRPARLFADEAVNCFDGGLPPTPSCPTPTRSVFGGRSRGPDMNLSAFEFDGSGSAFVDVSWFDSLGLAGGTLFHSISASVPSDRVSISDSLGSATIRGARGTFFSGTARFDATDPALSNASPCGEGGNKEAVSRFRQGRITGDFRADSFIGADRKLSDGRLRATADRTFVRD
ncbi:MAG: hypothetical protein M3O86_03915 [Actinomycetota bacterium]|nr:hypothetical protein [Actinomycetota bacterium]